MPPNLRHLRAFREVARLGNISRASERVHLSQPAITQAISGLEALLGTALFERRSNGMVATEPGQLYLDRVEHALGFLESGAREAARLGQRRGARGFSSFDRLVTTAQLRALIAVSDSGNFSLAARTIGLSQPTLHRSARDLERLAGIPLFDKTREGIEPTRAARVLARQARLAFAELEQGLREVAAWRGFDSGRIVVGTLPLARSFVLPSAITRLLQARPEVRVSVVDGPYDDLLHGLRHGTIDLMIGALRDPVPIDDVVQEPLFEDLLAVVTRSGHPLTGKRAVATRELADHPWVVPRHGTPTREHFEALFDAAGIAAPASLVETSSLVLIRGLLLESDRITLISAQQIRHEEQQGLLVALPCDLAHTRRPIGLTLRRNWRPTATQTQFLDLLRAAGRQAGQR